MTAAVAALAMVATSLLPPTRLVPSGIDLQYRRPLGQVVQYHLLLRVEGSQVSLGERRPVRVRAEVEFAEEVIAHERGGTIVVKRRDPQYQHVLGSIRRLRLNQASRRGRR